MSNFSSDTLTTAAGYFAFELTRSSCLNSDNKYTFEGTYPDGRRIFKVDKAVPDSTTYRLTW